MLALGLSLLSLQAWNLDSERTEAQRRALHEEQIRLSLWRLDSALGPVLVRESGRTHAQFVDPQDEGLPSEVRLRFAHSDRGQRVTDPNALAEARELFTANVDPAWLDAQVPRPEAERADITTGKLLDGDEADRQGLGAAGSGLTQVDALQATSNQAKQGAKSGLVLPEQQTIAYQNTVSDNEFQRRVQNIQKSSPGYGGSLNYRQNDDWAWNGARSNAKAANAPIEQDKPSDKVGRRDDEHVSHDDDAQRGASGSTGKIAEPVTRKGQSDGQTKGQTDGQTKNKLGPAASLRVDDVLSHEPLFVRESVMAALWRNDMLLLARRAEAEDGRWIEGTWLDWPTLEQSLLTEIEDLLPGATLEPVRGTPQDTSRLLATLPVRLVPGAMPAVAGAGWTAMRVAIGSAWLVALIVGIAAFFLLRATLELSQRRGAFVSAVTHELRTPLTTFRMYTEMLADGMVRNEEQRQSYIETLRSEAHRLDNLVQNVLTYARIEDRSAQAQIETMSVGELVSSIVPRLESRCDEAECGFEVADSPELNARNIDVDRTAVEQILFNLVDNAAKYGRAAEDPRVTLNVQVEGGDLRLRVCDNGPGIPDGERARVFRPFEKAQAHAAGTLPGVGLGLALCQQLAAQLGGRLELVQREAPGACFELRLPQLKS